MVRQEKAEAKVLLVEDDFFVAQDVYNELRHRGFRVIGPAGDRRMALSLIEQEKPDSAILDINLGGEMAFDVADTLWSLRIPFVFISGYAREFLPGRFRDVPLVEKPFRSNDLIERLPTRAARPAVTVDAPSQSRNWLLRALEEREAPLLRPHSRAIRVGGRHGEPHDTDVLFPEKGFCSLIVRTGQHGGAEVAMVGCEGVVGAPLAPQVDAPPLAALWHEGAEATAVPADVLAVALGRSPALQHHLATFHRGLMLQMAWTAQVNASLDLPRRLGRWILMAADRCGDSIRITHAELGRLLGVRRAGVTTGMHVLEGEGWIRSTRGLVALRDRADLQRFVGEGYGSPDALTARPARREAGLQPLMTGANGRGVL